MTDSWGSYPSIYALGHKALADLFDGPVVVEEKIDGSQFSFGIFGGQLRVRSKGAEFPVDAPEAMFRRAVETATRLVPLLHDGWTYRCEYLSKPKHNTLAYGRVPAGHLILFDVNVGAEAYLPTAEKRDEADRLGLDCVPVLHEGSAGDLAWFQAFLGRESCLGGVSLEGVVVKNYARFGADKKVLMGKHVSEAFKEAHAREWKTANPGRQEILASLIADLKTEARWRKSVQHLREAGKLEGSPRDIGLLLRAVAEDVKTECEAEIKDRLFAWAWDQVRRGVTAGLPQWYKDELAAAQFERAE